MPAAVAALEGGHLLVEAGAQVGRRIVVLDCLSESGRELVIRCAAGGVVLVARHGDSKSEGSGDERATKRQGNESFGGTEPADAMRYRITIHRMTFFHFIHYIYDNSDKYSFTVLYYYMSIISFDKRANRLKQWAGRRCRRVEILFVRGDARMADLMTTGGLA
ncbi:MAG: hypothetical protein AB7P52_05195 [Alphaproteobacteria bacterium]